MFEWLPESLLVFSMRRMVKAETAAIKLGHVERGPAKCQCLADEFRSLIERVDVQTPSIDAALRELIRPRPRGVAPECLVVDRRSHGSMPSRMPVSITTDLVWAEVEGQRFAVLSYVTPNAEARSAGVVYIVRDRKLYVRASTDSWKSRHIYLNPHVALNVTIPKRIPFMPWIKIPAATIAFHGAARVVAAQDAEPGVMQALARAIPDHSGLRAQISIIEVEPAGHFLTYGVGASLLAMRDPKTARARVPVA